jgi:hypothetical protein
VFKKQGQVVLNTGCGHAIANVFVNAALGRVAFKQFAPAAAKQRSRLIVHGEFAPGQQPDFGHRVQAALAVGVEGSDGVDFVVKQVHPVGHQRPHREQVDQASAHGVFARAYHLGHVLVARQSQLGLKLRLV